MKQISRNLLIRLINSTALLLCSTLVVSAQNTKPDEYPKVEVFVGYSALGEANSRGISLGPNNSVAASYSAEPGFETSVMRNFSKHFGIKGDFSAHFNNESRLGPDYRLHSWMHDGHSELSAQDACLQFSGRPGI